MNLRNTKLYPLCQVLFAEGWFFFVPYLFFYIVFKNLNLKISYLENIFLFLHIFISLLFIYYLYNIYTKKHLFKLLFWLGLILLFQVPGAYLEFPSDAWEHFRRIFEWQVCTIINDHSIPYKFTYFWGWTLMSEVEPLYRRTALDIYSTFWQFLLAYQFYLFALRVGFSESWAKVQVLGTICLFGTNVFSFYRYYALSSTPLAYIAYLRVLIVILDIFDGKRKKAYELIFLIFIIYYNHYQELLLLVIAGLAIFLAKLSEKKQLEGKKFIYKLVLIFIVGVIGGALAIKLLQNHEIFTSHLRSVAFQNYVKEKTIHKWLIEPSYWSKWGILKIWEPKLPYFQTLGIYGCLSIGFSLILWNKYKLLSTLTIFPVTLLNFQLFTLFFASTSDYYTTFRVLYTFPYSFMLILGFKELFEFSKYLNPIVFLHKKNYGIILILLIFISLQPSLPWRGRLWYQLYKTPVQLSLKNLDVTAQWFFNHRQLGQQYVNAQWFFENPKVDFQCLLISDNATSFSLATHLGLIAPQQRLSPYNPSQNLKNFDNIKKYLQSESQQKICSFLVGIPAQINPPPISEIGKLSEHWPLDIVRQDFNYSNDFVEATALLTSIGWTKTFVPPFYWLYEAPSSETNQ